MPSLAADVLVELRTSHLLQSTYVTTVLSLAAYYLT